MKKIKFSDILKQKGKKSNAVGAFDKPSIASLQSRSSISSASKQISKSNQNKFSPTSKHEDRSEGQEGGDSESAFE